ncbi:L,D-transpeptidase family protein [Lelliottia sp. V106_10]|uniref:L,D-transpeptidase family protein n=1 Tax=Lelliottia wanjuensis TaxID=3050585 RepID=UPI00254DD44B|nr:MULTISPECIES: L,D-transpeptidase family protein [unclassified Lelliottia]MDK9354854.1 L,D-transpeptidase family protein [Lelliottia sp. V106_16]MDK9372062.1 L,D-transpeptidase family protein [Lelliottia sp. V106_10]MDK9598698.1 L,D-transpeptidase family protein [Lelliottia sp. V106_5]
MNNYPTFRRSLLAGSALLLIILCLLIYTRIMAKWGHATPPATLPATQQADLIIVHKASRSLTLMRQGISFASYPVSLGRNADAGPKQREGDKKTPQGRYYIDSRNARSRFSLSLHISYPNKTEIQHAKEGDYPPGENIMIHGVPNGWGWFSPLFQRIDWTDGCIAVTNDIMREIWQHVPTGTPVELRP